MNMVERDGKIIKTHWEAIDNKIVEIVEVIGDIPEAGAGYVMVSCLGSRVGSYNPQKGDEYYDVESHAWQRTKGASVRDTYYRRFVGLEPRYYDVAINNQCDRYEAEISGKRYSLDDLLGRIIDGYTYHGIVYNGEVVSTKSKVRFVRRED